MIFDFQNFNRLRCVKFAQAVFLFAMLLHVAQGEFGVIGGLPVYSVVVLVVRAYKNSTP